MSTSQRMRGSSCAGRLPLDAVAGAGAHDGTAAIEWKGPLDLSQLARLSM